MTHQAAHQRWDAFQSWKSSLDYMDADVIEDAEHYLECSIRETAECIPVDEGILLYIDSVSMWHAAQSPRTDLIERSVRYLDTIKLALIPID